MRKILICDKTLCSPKLNLSFKEKVEIARQLDKMQVDIIDLPAIKNDKTDPLFIATIAPLLSYSRLSLDVGRDISSVGKAAAAISSAKNAILRVSVPVSTVGMEYHCGLKAKNAAAFCRSLVSEAKKYCQEIEFCAEDATRADPDFLISVVSAVVDAGAKIITLVDDAGVSIPGESEKLLREVSDNFPGVCIGIEASDNIHMGVACSVSAIGFGAELIKTCITDAEIAKLGSVAAVLRARGDYWNVETGVKITEINRSIKKIEQIINPSASYSAENDAGENGIVLDKNDDITTVISAVRTLGYDLSSADEQRVYEEFKRVAEKKNVTAGELDAIVAGTALQVPPTYTLVSYLINSSNIMTPSAHIKLQKDGKNLEDICMGDGPIDAAFKTIEAIIGHHYELDDFSIDSVTRGHEAVGNAVVRLRNGGKLYSGTGISTDIISASIRAYISALNKIVYEEA